VAGQLAYGAALNIVAFLFMTWASVAEPWGTTPWTRSRRRAQARRRNAPGPERRIWATSSGVPRGRMVPTGQVTVTSPKAFEGRTMNRPTPLLSATSQGWPTNVGTVPRRPGARRR
jgi:hypothetical protein